MNKKKTLADVAATAGVSKMTASRALRGDKDVSEAARNRVVSAAREIGYYGNHLAASLSSARSDLIGVVVPSLSNIVFPEVMSGVAEVVRGAGFQPVFGVTDYDAEREYETIRSMLSWRPAGLIVTGLDQSAAVRRLLDEAGLPIVQIMDCDGDPVDACVGFSHEKAGYDIGLALVAAGRTRFGYVGCNLDKDTRAMKRREGFLKALRERDAPLLGETIGKGLSSVKAGRALAQEALTARPEIDCLYFSNDDLAFGGLSYCIGAGLAVPERVALAGFNGLDLLDGFDGQIATSRTARRAIGEAAARIIVESFTRPGDGPARMVVLEPVISLGRLGLSGAAARG